MPSAGAEYRWKAGARLDRRGEMLEEVQAFRQQTEETMQEILRRRPPARDD